MGMVIVWIGVFSLAMGVAMRSAVRWVWPPEPATNSNGIINGTFAIPTWHTGSRTLAVMVARPGGEPGESMPTLGISGGITGALERSRTLAWDSTSGMSVMPVPVRLTWTPLWKNAKVHVPSVLVKVQSCTNVAPTNCTKLTGPMNGWDPL